METTVASPHRAVDSGSTTHSSVGVASAELPGSADHQSRESSGGGRQLVVWCPDWPVVAAASKLGLDAATPIGVVDHGEIFAASSVARVEGVRRGMRRRDAAARCPELVVVDRNAESEIRTFEVVLSALEEIAAGVAPIRPGLCALSVPARFYGGERQAAAVVAEHLVAAGVWDCRIGVADGRFAAEQAARQAPAQDCVLVPAGGSAEYLAPLSIRVLDDVDLVTLLRRLGIGTLGAFAELSARDVLTRFGSRGAWIHRQCRGRDTQPVVSRRPPLEISRTARFFPGLETIEPIAFSSRAEADACVAELARHGLVCTEVRIEVATDGGWTGSRVWAHSRWFAGADLVDRLYWQLQGDPAPEPVVEVRFLPEAVESLADHGEGLWGSARSEQVERGVARLQGMLGPEEVLAPTVQGGRSPRDRQQLSPWGSRAPDGRPVALPWPGTIPPPAPARVFSQPIAARVLDGEGRPVTLDDRGLVSSTPVFAAVGDGGDLTRVDAWAGPWPIEELWWDEHRARRLARFQVVGRDGRAWLMIVEGGRWWTEASYD